MFNLSFVQHAFGSFIAEAEIKGASVVLTKICIVNEEQSEIDPTKYISSIQPLPHREMRLFGDIIIRPAMKHKGIKHQQAWEEIKKLKGSQN